MKNNLLLLNSCLSVLVLSSSAIASEIIIDSTNYYDFDATTIQSDDTFFDASTSVDSFNSFDEIEPSNKEIFNDSSLVQRFGGGRTPSNWYGGASIGPFFSTSSSLSNGFGGGAYVGYKFNPNIGAEVDVIYAGGDFKNRNSGDYGIFSVIGSGRLTNSFGVNNPRWNYFGTAGAGLTRNFFSNFNNNTSFTVQLKGGVGYDISNNTSGFAQLRYLNISDNRSNYLSTELGINYKF